MASVEKISIPITKAMLLGFSVVTIVINILTVYFTIELKFQQQGNDLILAVEKLNNKDAILEMKINQNKAQIDVNELAIESIANFIGEGIKPDRPKRKNYR